MKTKPIIIGIMVAVGAAALLLACRKSSPTVASSGLDGTVGQKLAEQARDALGGDGSVVIIGNFLAKIPRSTMGQQLASFQTAMKAPGMPRVAAVEWLSDPDRGSMMESGMATADQLSEIINKYPDANGLIIFAGLPPLTPQLAGELSERKLKVLAVCGYSTVVRAWLKAKALDAVVIPRMGSPSQADPNTLMGRFDQQFQLVTPKTLEQLPY